MSTLNAGVSTDQEGGQTAKRLPQPGGGGTATFFFFGFWWFLDQGAG